MSRPDPVPVLPGALPAQTPPCQALPGGRPLVGGLIGPRVPSPPPFLSEPGGWGLAGRTERVVVPQEGQPVGVSPPGSGKLGQGPSRPKILQPDWLTAAWGHSLPGWMQH